MKRTVILCSALALTCAAAFFPVAASPSDEGTQHRTHVRYVGTIPASVEALSPSMLAPALRRDDDLDGPTRDAGECNRGCIDN
jgi:hypothetical protein